MKKYIIGVVVVALMLGCTTTSTAPDDPEEVKLKLVGTWLLKSRAEWYPASSEEKSDVSSSGLSIRFSRNDTAYFMKNDSVYDVAEYYITGRDTWDEEQYPWSISLDNQYWLKDIHELTTSSLVMGDEDYESDVEYYERKR